MSPAGSLKLASSSLKHSASTPPARLQTTEPTMWQYSWNAGTFGTQLQIDAAEKQLFVHSAQEAKGTGKGLRVGKGARHWTAPMVYSSETNPYPIDLEMVQVSQVAFVCTAINLSRLRTR